MKTELRRELKALRDGLSDKKIRDSKITDQLIALPDFAEAETVLLYCSSGSEVSTEEFFRICLEKNKNVAFPVCLNRDGIMKFFLVESENDLTEGMYGIRAPESRCPELKVYEKCICIVPGLAFDSRGHRIGYGKGYYDRFLSGFPGVSVGLCYDELHLAALPVKPHDINVNYLITDKNTYNYNSKEDLKNG